MEKTEVEGGVNMELSIEELRKRMDDERKANNPKVKPGDKIEAGVMIQDGSIYWGYIQTVIWVSSDGRPYYRAKWGKVEKTPDLWRFPNKS